MPKFKEANYQQMQWIGVSFDEQILPGTFEHTLNYLIDNEVDLVPFCGVYKNDSRGAKAFNPAILLKIVLYAYSRGIVSSRRIAHACKHNIIFMALSENTKPHFTTIASLISSMEEQVTSLFRDILLVCDEKGLIGKDMFAVDGCKLPSNASKQWSGTKEDLKKKAAKLETAIGRIINKHKALDEAQQESDIVEHEKAKLQTLQKNYQKIQDWLNENDDRQGSSGHIVKSNITDNESAKISTSHGVTQGYNGVAMVDSLNQVAVHGEAYGSGDEGHTLEPMEEGTRQRI